MDYTLVHYRVDEWERRAYAYAKKKLIAQGWPVHDQVFDPDLMIRGLVIDTQLGNILKVNSFGYVKQACHGTRPLTFEQQRDTYSRTLISLAERRYVFLNTLFSLSEACLYAQVVDLLDTRRLTEVLGYIDLYERVRAIIDESHLEGELKAEIMAAPERFVELDPDMPLTLLDQRQAGKKLLLITNSEWAYTTTMMTHVFDRYLPEGMTWRDVFDIVIVSARKPEFFSQRSPLFEVVNEQGLLRPTRRSLRSGGLYLGGCAAQVEEYLGIPSDLILYVGDHMWGDVQVSKNLLRWRTALVVRELESDLAAIEGFSAGEAQLQALMEDKERLEFQLSRVRLQLQRKRASYVEPPPEDEVTLEKTVLDLRSRIVALDEQIAPLANAAARLNNVHWGLTMRAGNDKSHLARQIERYADIYMSRVSNMLYQTPFVYLRAQRGSLPHDFTLEGGRAPCR